MAMSEKIERNIGQEMHGWARDLFPICRSLTGNGTRETLAYLREIVPGMELHEVPSGTQAMDWVVPDEWNIKGAYIENEAGERLVDFADNNLHVVGYSEPVDGIFTLEELEPHLHSLPDRPNTIPYITSYYVRNWGFCLTQAMRDKMKEGRYRCVIDSTLGPGSLTYGELVLPGKTSSEIFLSTYVCHPSMANNELSGPVVTAALARSLAAQTDRRYGIRVVFIPETIGSIVYLSRHLDNLKKNVVAGFNITCTGDERAWSYLPSRQGDTLADRAAQHVLDHKHPEYVRYSYLDRGSDERQYCSPGVDLPVASVMRTKYGAYPEYHTSDDDLSVVTPDGLAGSYDALRRCIECVELNDTYQTQVLCEPQLGRRNLISNLGLGPAKMGGFRRRLSNLLAYSDGSADLISVANAIGEPVWELSEPLSRLLEQGLITRT
jgi:aminopeptidase-like protein